MESFEIKSALDCAPIASSTFAPIELPLLNSCLEKYELALLFAQELIKIYTSDCESKRLPSV